MIEQFYLTQAGIIDPVQNGPGSIANEGVLHIPQRSKTGPSPSDAL